MTNILSNLNNSQNTTIELLICIDIFVAYYVVGWFYPSGFRTSLIAFSACRTRMSL